MALSDTIFAMATAAGRAGVAVLRVSGPQAGVAAARLCDGRALPAPRRASLRRFVDLEGSEIDRGLLLWFPGPDSFSGEDMAEFHVHGGRSVVEGIVAALGAVAGCRPAGPGEFSRRAFMNGRLDLTQVEAIADLVDAETAAQRRQALRQLEGALGRLYEEWRSTLVGALAHVEALIDFSDEDLPAGMLAGERPAILLLRQAVGGHLADGRRGERLRDGASVVILGPPNAGKSSLLNALARRDVAIVAETAGTTRDIIEVHLDLGGFPAVLADTAGLRESADLVEVEGVRRALARAQRADVKLVVADGGAAAPLDAVSTLLDADSLLVLNKCDLAGAMAPGGALLVSARTGFGLAALETRLAEMVAARLEVSEAPELTRVRHRSALEDCRGHLDGALAIWDDGALEEIAEELRLAARALGRITGRVDVEDVLDVIFADFCIGK